MQVAEQEEMDNSQSDNDDESGAESEDLPWINAEEMVRIGGLVREPQRKREMKAESMEAAKRNEMEVK